MHGGISAVQRTAWRHQRCATNSMAAQSAADKGFRLLVFVVMALSGQYLDNKFSHHHPSHLCARASSACMRVLGFLACIKRVHARMKSAKRVHECPCKLASSASDWCK